MSPSMASSCAGLALRLGLILSNALLDMYAKYREMNTAIRIFGEAGEADGISSNTVVAGFANAGMLDLSSRYFAEAPASFKLAYAVFEKAMNKDVTLWTAMISGFAFHGHGAVALDLFWKMQAEGIEPNAVTLVVVLSACGHAGLLDEGCKIFDTLKQRFNVEAGIEHFGCMVDLLARSGRLSDAVVWPMKRSRSIWGSILSLRSACQNTEVAAIASKELLCLEPAEEGGYVLLSNLYAAEGMSQLCAVFAMQASFSPEIQFLVYML
ncbi:hypothetical protein ABZP36_004629 [Zizania latifolia]